MTAERSEAARPLPSPPGAEGGLDALSRCAFCGRLADPAQERCPHCGRSLSASVGPSLAAGPSLRPALFLIGILAVVGLLETAPPLFAWQVSRGADSAPYRLLLQTPGADLLLGRFLDWPGPVALTLLAIAAGRAVVLAACACGLYLRAAPAYYLALGVLVLDALWGIYRLAGGYAGPVGVVGDLVLVLAILPLLFAADRDFAAARRPVETGRGGST